MPVNNYNYNYFLSGLCALCHFRRPDVTLKGDVVTIHPVSERDPVPLGIPPPYPPLINSAINYNTILLILF